MVAALPHSGLGATLPSRGIAPVVEYCDHLHAILSQSVKHPIWEPANRRSSNLRIIFGVQLRVIPNPRERLPDSSHEIRSQPRGALFVPLSRFFQVCLGFRG